MGLEADDGRPETSPPPRRGVQTADRAVVRERQAIPGDQGRARHRAIDPAAPGPGHPRQRLHPGRGQPHARAERAGRAGEARPTVGDGGGRFRTSGAGIRTKAEAIRSDAGRCPISAQCRILGVAKSTYCWMLGHPEAERVDPPMRVTRSACGATAARSMGAGRSSTPRGMRASSCRAAASTGSCVFCQVGVGRFGVSFSPCERRVSGRFGVGRSCWLLVIALVIA